MLSDSIFFVVLVADTLLLLTLLYSLVHPGSAVWPPSQKFSWQYFYDWMLNTVVLFGPVVLSIVDFDSGPFPQFWRIPIGVASINAGLILCWLGERELERGGHGKLVTAGIYQYSRNPQYTGNILFMVGFAVVGNSEMALNTSLWASICFIAAVFDEEKKLKEKFGRKYSSYLQNHPRFLGIPRQ